MFIDYYYCCSILWTWTKVCFQIFSLPWRSFYHNKIHVYDFPIGPEVLKDSWSKTYDNVGIDICLWLDWPLPVLKKHFFSIFKKFWTTRYRIHWKQKKKCFLGPLSKWVTHQFVVANLSSQSMWYWGNISKIFSSNSEAKACNL